MLSNIFKLINKNAKAISKKIVLVYLLVTLRKRLSYAIHFKAANKDKTGFCKIRK